MRQFIANWRGRHAAPPPIHPTPPTQAANPVAPAARIGARPQPARGPQLPERQAARPLPPPAANSRHGDA